MEKSEDKTMALPAAESFALKLAGLLARILESDFKLSIPANGQQFTPEQGRTRVKHDGVWAEERLRFQTKHDMMRHFEGQRASWPRPAYMQELHVACGPSEVKVYIGAKANARLTLLQPSAWGRPDGAIAEVLLDGDFLIYRVSLNTLARSAQGSAEKKHYTLNYWRERLLDDKFTPQFQSRHYLRTSRFYECVNRLHAFFNLSEKVFPDHAIVLYNLKIELLSSMIREGVCRSSLVTVWLKSLECILRPVPMTDLEKLIKKLPKEIQVMLYRMRREFRKDDVNLIQNMEEAVARFSEEPRHNDFAKSCLNLWQERFSLFLRTRGKDVLAKHLLGVPLQGSGATVFHRRVDGGGSADLHMIVGMHRLSQGKRSRLTNVFGDLPEDMTVFQLLGTIATTDARSEIEKACEWFLDTMVQELPRVLTSIHPNREAKARTFCLFDFATQFGCSYAALFVRLFLKECDETPEAFSGISEAPFWNRFNDAVTDYVKEHKEQPYVLSLDSKVSTDPLAHLYCEGVFSPAYPYGPPVMEKAVKCAFQPMILSGATKRPKDVVYGYGLNSQIGERTGARFVHEDRPVTPWSEREHVQLFVDNVPDVALRKSVNVIETFINKHDAFVLKAPTGSGKTVLAATIARSIIQFPSIAALLIFSQTCKHFGIPHNVYYSKVKRTDNVDEDGNPHTILATSSFVTGLARKHPNMLVVLDEAETRLEDFSLNILRCRKIANKVVIASATPEALRLQLPVLTLNDTTHFQVTEEEMDEKQMIHILRETKEKSLVCLHSEPYCRYLAKRIPGACVIDAYARSTGKMEELLSATVLLSTNVIRTSVTIVGLKKVYDYGLMYEMVDSPLQGFQSLHLFKVSDAQRLQLRGRVGRVSDGCYIKVRSHFLADASKFETMLLSRLPNVTNYMRTHDVDDLPIPASPMSLLMTAYHQKLMESVFAISYKAGIPLDVLVAKRFLNTECSQPLVTFIAFESLGLASRMKLLSNGEDRERRLYDDWLSVSNHNFLLKTREVVDRLEEMGFFNQEIFLLRKWTQGLRTWGSGLEYTQNLLTFAMINWRSIAICASGLMSGKYRNFQLRARHTELDGHYILVRVDFENSGLTYAYSVHLDEDQVAWVNARLSTCITVPYAVTASPSDELYSFMTRVVETPGAQKRKKVLHHNVVGNSWEHDPTELKEIWNYLKSTVEDLCILPMTRTRRGCHMSCVASFPVLNVLASSVIVYMKKIHSKTFFSECYGDDNITVGSKALIEEVVSGRELLSLATNTASTGVARVGEDAVAVYTERFYDLGDRLNPIQAPKPKGVLNLWLSLHPGLTITGEEYFYADMVSVSEALRHRLPRWHSAVHDLAIKQPYEKSRRTTAPRRLVTKMINEMPRRAWEFIVTPYTMSVAVDTLEAMILALYPSTRGTPVREPHTPRVFYLTVKNAEAINGILEKMPEHFAIRPIPVSASDDVIGTDGKVWVSPGPSSDNGDSKVGDLPKDIAN